MNFKFIKHSDYIFLSCVLVLVVFGLIMLSSASSDLGKMRFDDTYYYLKHQIIYGLSFGIIGFLLAYFVNYKFWQKTAFWFLLASLILLVLVFTPLGFSANGATRWINLGFTSVQPAEFLKFTFIIYLAAWLSPKKDRALGRQKNLLSGYLPFLIISGLVAALIIAEHSTGTVAIILAAGLLVYFISGARLSFILGTMLVGLLGLTLLIYLTPYRFARVESYFKGQGEVYQVNQALTAIGSGGISGVGFGNSTIKFETLPEPQSDSIFAVIAEELGFVGAVFLLGIFALLFIRGMTIAKNSPDQFAKLVAAGFASVIAIQTFINIGGISGVIPLSGVPLPFISYGGTALAVFLTMAGVIGNISKYT